MKRPTLLRRRSVRLALAVAALCVLGGAALLHFEDRLFPKNFGPVVDGVIYRSGQIDRRLIKDVLREHGIARVLDLQNYEFDDPDHAAEKRAIESLGLAHDRIAMYGNGVGTPEQYADAVAILHEAATTRAPLLVHCSAGAQRVGGVVAAYRLLVQGWPKSRVRKEAVSYGWKPVEDTAWPAFLDRHMDAIARGLVDRGVIASVPRPLPVFGAGVP